jgi:hypothetical protein
MPASAIQYEVFDPPARLFYMNATSGGVPLTFATARSMAPEDLSGQIASLISTDMLKRPLDAPEATAGVWACSTPSCPGVSAF